MKGKSSGASVGRGLLTIVFLAFPVRAVVAGPTDRAVVGTVVDVTGAPVPGAIVTLRRPSVSFARSVRAQDGGQFHIDPGAEAADYELSATAEGFSVARTGLAVPPRDLADIRLVLRPGVFTESVEVVGTRLVGGAETTARLPGSVDTVDKATLETSRVLNVNEALRKTSGLYVRDEEGFALRPNIGIRGLNPTRSSKVLLLEDGLFLTFAPYGDNATYYHPPIERFEGIEVVKGAGQIAYGPMTVGGVINYLTPDPPARPEGKLRFTGGNRGYANAQVVGGGTWGRTGLLAELMHKQGDGSRDHVHSKVEDANLKAVVILGSTHSLTAKANYYREDSEITYSGLTRAEWELDPRQNPFVNDAFAGWRTGGSVKHNWIVGPEAVLSTQLYGSRFSRDWWRQSSNSGQRPNDRADAKCGGMQNLLSTCGNEGRLRDYDHFGLEPRLRFGMRVFGLHSEAEAGVRVHFETQERRQQNGDTPTARSGVTAEDNRRENRAYSAFVQDRLLLGRFTLSAGVRFEAIDYERTNRLANGGMGASGKTAITQWVPGVGMAWAPSEKLNLFAGVHRGFAPPRTEDIISQTGGTVELAAEKSWNYEAGVRTAPAPGVRVDATLFRSDYENQVVAASLAGGVGAALTNGGATLQQGLEFSARFDSATLTGSAHNLFARGALTVLPTARFEGLRFSSVPGASTVSVSGNRLPYAPDRLLTAAFGYSHPRGFTAQVEAVHAGAQWSDDLSSVESSVDGQRGRIERSTVWNASFNYEVKRLRSVVFVAVKNALDTLYLADRSRGMIPGPPRLTQIGIATTF